MGKYVPVQNFPMGKHPFAGFKMMADIPVIDLHQGIRK
jgi:hypothetical protein